MALAPLSAIPVLRAPEWLEFTLLMEVLVGAHRFVVAPSGQRNERDSG